MFLAGVAMGTGSTITVKVLYALESIGLSGHSQRFEKPLLTTWVMFLSMTLALPIHFLVEWRQHAVYHQAVAYHRVKKLPQPTSLTAPVEVPWRTFFLLVIPAAFDLLGTALASIGLLFTTVSVYQLVRCSVIIVTAILKATILQQKLATYMWIGIGINTLAMVVVSSTSFLPEWEWESNHSSVAASTSSGSASTRDPRIGIFFILLSCLVQGSQYVFEEKVMTIDNAPPLVVVGMEGLWGTLLMPLVVFPWAYILPGSDVGGCLENLFDSYVMISNSTVIQLVLLAFTLTVCLYNIFCIYVTFLLNSIWHAILDNFRPISVWGTDLALFYLFTHHKFGEPWTIYSWIELIGMILLFAGTAVYNGNIQIPQLQQEYEEFLTTDQQEEEEDLGTGTSLPGSAFSAASADGVPTEKSGLLRSVHGRGSGSSSGSLYGSGLSPSNHVDISSPLLTRSPLVTKQLLSRESSRHSHSPLSHSLSHSSGLPGYYSNRDLNAEFGRHFRFLQPYSLSISLSS